MTEGCIEEMEVEPIAELPKVTGPRSVWIDVILVFLSLGLYSGFLFSGQVRDLNKLYGENLKPIWWFFVPPFMVAQLAALPALNKILSNCEKRLDIPCWTSSFKTVTVISILLTALYGWAGSNDELPYYWGLLIGAVYCGCMVLWLFRINRIKRADSRLISAGRVRGIRFWEWITMAVLILLWALFGFGISESIQTDVIEEHQIESWFEDAEGGFTFPIRQLDWLQVQEDNDALYNFKARQSDLQAYLFDYPGRSVNDLSQNRLAEAMDSQQKYECHEEQSFVEGTLNVEVIQICQHVGVLFTDASMSKFIEIDDIIYELYVYVYTDQKPDGKVMRSATSAIQGFTLL